MNNTSTRLRVYPPYPKVIYVTISQEPHHYICIVNKIMKLILVCILCFAIIYGIVYVVMTLTK